MEPSNGPSCTEPKCAAEVEPISENLLDLLILPAEDVIYKDIFSKLGIKDLLNLRDADPTEFADLVDGYLPKVEVLKLADCDIPDHHVELLSEKCANVKEVSLEGSSITSEQAKRLFAGKKKIKSLNLSGTTGLDSACLQSVIVECEGLKVLRLQGCHWLTIGCLHAITLHQRYLEVLDISWCQQLGLTHFLLLCLSTLTRLRFLNLAMTSPVPVSMIKMLTPGCRNLEYLEFSHTVQSSSSGFPAVFQFMVNRLSHLRLVKLHTPKIELYHVRHINGDRRLIRLDARWCQLHLLKSRQSRSE